MRITPLYDTARPPIEGYDLEINVLLNPTGATWDDFAHGGFSASDTETALLTTLDSLIKDDATSAEDQASYTTRRDELTKEIAARQERMGRALHQFYGQTPVVTLDVDGAHVPLDFSTPEAALRTGEDKRLPDEIAFWFTALPLSIIEHRREFIRENLKKSFGNRS